MTNTTNPHAQWLNEWRAVCAAWDMASEGTPEEIRLWARRTELDELISETPTQTPEQMFSQMEWMKADLDKPISVGCSLMSYRAMENLLDHLWQDLAKAVKVENVSKFIPATRAATAAE